MGVAVNLTVISPALEQITADALRPQFEQEPATYNLFENASGPKFVNGKGFRIPSYLRPPTGVGSIGEGGSFKQPGAPTLDDMYAYPFNLNKAFEITGSALENFNDSSSMIDGLTGYMEWETMAMKKENNFQVFGDGSALRATYKSGTTTVTCYSPLADNPGANFGRTKGAMQIRVGEAYDWYDSTLATYRGTVVPTAQTNTTFTIPVAVAGATDGDIILLSGSLNKSPRGLPYIVNNDTGTFQLQSRSTYPQLKAPVTDLALASITVQTFNYTKGNLVNRAGVGKAKTVMAIMSSAQNQALTQLGQNFKRWDGDAKIFDGSFDKFQHGDTVSFVDPDCDEDRIYLVVKDNIKKYPQREFGLYKLDGNSLRMRAGVTGYGSDSYTGALGSWYTWGSENPLFNALIKRASVVGLSTQVASLA